MASIIQSAWIRKVGPLGSRVERSLGISPVRYGDHGPWNLGLLHGLDHMWVHERLYQDSPQTGRYTADTFTTLGVGTSSHRYGNSPGPPGTCLLLLFISPLLPQEKHTAWVALSMGGWALGRVLRRRAYPPSSPGSLPSPQ